MCESKIVLIEGGKKSVVMDAAAKVLISSGGDATCIDITGEEVLVKGVQVREMNLMKHEIVLQRGR